MSGTTVKPEGDRWEELARAALVRTDEREQAELIRELLAFEIGGTPYAVPIERVREILRMRPITPIPRAPDVVMGVISIRGEVVEVIDLRRRLGLSASEPERRTRIVVIHGFDGRVTGCMVDRVQEVLRVPGDAIRPASEADAANVTGLCKRGDAFVSMLDIDKVLDLEH